MSLSPDSDRPRRYFSVHYILLRILGIGWWHHPDEGNTTNFPGLYIYYTIVTEILLVYCFVIFETIDPFMGDKDLDRFMFSISFVITHDLTLLKMYIFFFKNREIQQIVHVLDMELHNFYQNNTKNRKTIRFTRIMTGSFVFFGWMTIANVNAYGIYEDLRWKAEMSELNDTAIKPSRTLPQPIYIPWNYQTDVSYICTYLLQGVGLLWTGHIVLTIDTFIASLIIHMSSQFEILQEAIITAYDRTITKLSEGLHAQSNTLELPDENNVHDVDSYDYNEAIVKRYCSGEQIEIALENTLKDCFLQHQLLIGCVEKFANIYSNGFMTQLISSMTAICVVMVQLSHDVSSFKSIRIVTTLAFFFAMVIQLAIQCFSGSELTDQASKVSEAVMQSKWERMPPRLRKLLALAMVRAQRPLLLSAAGFAYMNNDCFLAIMKGAYSYYAVLSQTQV